MLGTTGRGRGSLRLSALGLLPSCAVGMPPPLPAAGEGVDEGTWDCQVLRAPRAPTCAVNSRFLVLVALQTAHLPHIHLGRVYVWVDHKLILADAGKGDRVRWGGV